MRVARDGRLTVTPSVPFDETGRALATASRRLPQSIPCPHHVERDMETLWQATCEVIAEVLTRVTLPASDIVGIAATAHGDGLYLLDRAARPLGPGILSLDSRAQGVVDGWDAAGLFPEALALTGQVPHASAPSALLAHIRDTDPDRFAAIGHVLSCKDWLRTCLTGTVGIDQTEASTAFTDVETQTYSDAALTLYGLDALRGALPDIATPDAIVGRVTPEAAHEPACPPGTPVMAGLHDVTASALGIGGQRPGVMDVVAGTYSINQLVTAAPTRDAAWFCRNGILPGQWNAMSISLTSTTNYDWFIATFCAGEDPAGLHDRLAEDLRRAQPVDPRRHQIPGNGRVRPRRAIHDRTEAALAQRTASGPPAADGHPDFQLDQGHRGRAAPASGLDPGTAQPGRAADQAGADAL